MNSPIRLATKLVLAMLLAACSGQDARLTRHEGSTVAMTFDADGLETSRVDGTALVELSALDGQRRQLTLLQTDCSFTATERDDGQIEGFEVESQPSCRLESLLAAGALPPGAEARLSQSNMSFYEAGDGDPVIVLSGSLSGGGAVNGTWAWQFFAPHDE